MAKIEPISHLEQIIVDCFGGGSGYIGTNEDIKYYFSTITMDISVINGDLWELTTETIGGLNYNVCTFKNDKNIKYLGLIGYNASDNYYVRLTYEDGSVSEIKNVSISDTINLSNTNVVKVSYLWTDYARGDISGTLLIGIGNDGASHTTKNKEFRYVNFSKLDEDTNFIADADGNYTYNLNNKTITNIKFTGNFFANMGTLTFVGKNDFVLKKGSGFQSTELKDTNFTGLTLTKDTNGLMMSGNMILTLE